jgi:hypothetical protein
MVRLWNLDGSARGHPLTGHVLEVYSVAFDPGGDVLASCSGDAMVRLWNLDGSARGQSLTGHVGGVRSVAFSPRGDVLASCGEDGTVRLWNVASGVEVSSVHLKGTRHAGFFRNSLWVLQYPCSLNTFSLSLEPRASLLLGNRDSSIGLTMGGWYSGDSKLAESVKLFQGETPLNVATAGRYSPEEVVATVTGERHWLRESWLVFSRGVQRAWQFYKGLNGVVQATLGATAAYSLLLVTIVTIWLVRPDLLAHWAMPSHTAPESPGWEVVTKGFALVNWSGTTQRALDRWLARHAKELEKRCFEERKTLEDRPASQYVGLETSEHVDAWKQVLAGHEPLRVWATGPGGCGKTTLAIMLARQARDVAGRVPSRPVFVEEDWGKDLVEHVARLLHVGDRRPTAKMVKKLGHSGRLVLVIDGLSERRNETPVEQIQNAASEGIFRYLFVTSRSSPPEGEWFQTVCLEPVPPDRFDEFLEKYDIEERESAVAELRELSGDQPVRALFLRLAAEQLRRGADVPVSYDELVLDFVVGSRPSGKGALREASFLRAAANLAYKCVVDEDSIGPRLVAENVLLATLGEKASADPFLTDEGTALSSVAVLDQLITCGLLHRSVEVTRSFIGFSEDLIAEHLAAAYLFEADDKRILANLRRRKAWKDSGLAEALEHVQSARGAAE